MRLPWFALLTLAAGCAPGTCRGGPEPAAGSVSAAPSPPPIVDPDESEGAILGSIEPLREGGRTLEVTPPDDAEKLAFHTWIASAAAAAQRGGPPPDSAPPGFALTKIPGHALWLLAESGKRRGAGAILLRVGPAPPLLVEAPHTFFDQGTLPIAVTLFDALRGRALLVSTAHRYGGKPAPAGDDEDGEGQGESGGKARTPPSDVAHAERSFFLAG